MINILQKDKFIINILLLVVIVSIFYFFSQGYDLMPGDDQVHGLVAASMISETESINFNHPWNPSDVRPFYSNWVILEFPFHIVLTVLFLLLPGINVLEIANYFMLIIFSLGAVTVYLAAYELIKNRLLAVLTAFFSVFSMWYGLAFWGGHYAQIFGFLFIPLIVWSLEKYSQFKQSRFYWLAVFLTVLLYPVHVLSFLIGFLLIISYFLLDPIVLPQTKNKWWFRFWPRFFIFVGAMIILLLILVFSPASAKYLPNFGVENIYHSFSSLFSTTYADYWLFIFPLLILGALYLIKHRKITALLWLMIIYFLSQSKFLDITFFPYRFSEYISPPLIIVAMAGLAYLAERFKTKYVYSFTVTFLLIAFITFSLPLQVNKRNSYVNYYPGLAPATILAEDYQAFLWLKDNTPKESVIAGVGKFGKFVPVISQQKIELADGNNPAGLIFSSPEAAERYQIAQTTEIDYIIWDAVFSLSNFNYQSYADYTDNFPSDYFELVYDNQKTKIYKVRP